MEEFLEPSVLLYLGGIRSKDGTSTTGGLMYNGNRVTDSGLTPLPKGRFFIGGTYLESKNAIVVCGGFSSEKKLLLHQEDLIRLIKVYIYLTGIYFIYSCVEV